MAATGYFVGFGLNSNGPGMQGADIVVCREHGDGGVITAADYYAPRTGAPELDLHQDWVTTASGRMLSQPAVASPACPPCYVRAFNQCFRASSSLKSWTEARDECRSEGGDLAVVTNDTMNDFVAELSMSGGDFKPAVCVAWRQGGRSPAQGDRLPGYAACRAASSFRWVDGSSMDYHRFPASQPDCRCPAHAYCSSCVFMGWHRRTKTSYDKAWHDAPCYKPARFVCARPLLPGSAPAPSLQRELPRPTVTWCEVKRRRLTCEATADVQVKSADTPVSAMMAWSSLAAVSDTLAYHGPGNRRNLPPFSFAQPLASTAAVAAAPRVSDRALPPDATTIRVVSPAAEVPAAAGSYLCSVHVLPLPDAAHTSYHVVRFSVITNAQSPSQPTGVRHHINLNSCSDDVLTALGVSDGATVPCGTLMRHCKDVWLTQLTQQPGPTQGLAVGRGGVKVVAISRHFYNTAGLTGVVDVGNGYSLTYTASLRPHTLRTVLLGTPHIHVPPKSYGFVVSAHCSPQCTRGALGGGTILSVGFHMHGNGARTRLRHMRGSGNATRELAVVAAVSPWRASQAARKVSRVVEPGDRLLLECVYDNDLDRPITYGDNVDDEMCYAVLTYSGASVSTSVCLDMPSSWRDSSGRPMPYSHCPRSDCPQFGDPALCGAQMGCVWRGKSGCATDRVVDAQRYANPGLFTVGASSAALPATSAQCLAAANSTRRLHTPATAGACPAASTIQGARDLPQAGGAAVGLRLEWSADCDASLITFSLSMTATGGAGAWMALGLHDAGSAASPRAMPTNPMNGCDIVQVSAQTRQLADRNGRGFALPADKPGGAVATLVSTSVAGGRQTVTFSRPFASRVGSGGLSLSPDRFVWLVLAARRSSPSLSAKHQVAATYTAARVSFFDGIPESTRIVVLNSHAGGGSGGDGSLLRPVPVLPAGSPSLPAVPGLLPGGRALRYPASGHLPQPGAAAAAHHALLLLLQQEEGRPLPAVPQKKGCRQGGAAATIQEGRSQAIQEKHSSQAIQEEESSQANRTSLQSDGLDLTGV